MRSLLVVSASVFIFGCAEVARQPESAVSEPISFNAKELADRFAQVCFRQEELDWARKRARDRVRISCNRVLDSESAYTNCLDYVGWDVPWEQNTIGSERGVKFDYFWSSENGGSHGDPPMGNLDCGMTLEGTDLNLVESILDELKSNHCPNLGCEGVGYSTLSDETNLSPRRWDIDRPKGRLVVYIVEDCKSHRIGFEKCSFINFYPVSELPLKPSE